MRYSSPPVDAAPRSTSDASSAAYASSSGINPTPYASSGAALGGASNRGSGPAPGTGAGGGYAGQHGVQGYGAGGQPSYGGGGWPGMGMGMGMGMNDATAQMGVQFGKSAVAAGQDYVEKNVSAGATEPNACEELVCERMIDPALYAVCHETSRPAADHVFCAVHTLPTPPTHQDLVLRHEPIRPQQAPPAPIPLAAQAVGASGPASRGGKHGRVAAPQRRYQRSGLVHS